MDTQHLGRALLVPKGQRYEESAPLRFVHTQKTAYHHTKLAADIAGQFSSLSLGHYDHHADSVRTRVCLQLSTDAGRLCDTPQKSLSRP